MGQIFKKLQNYEHVLTANSLVLEIGTDRGLVREEYQGSTKYVSELAHKHNCKFATVDIDNDLLQPAKNRHLDAYNMTGEEFCKSILPTMDVQVTMVYLDNFDWDWNPPKNDSFIKEQQLLYKSKYGMTMNNVQSQSAHVAQTVLLLPYLADSCVVGFDDTFYMPHLGHYTGKGGSAVPVLLANGFKIAEEYESPVYGLIMTRNC